MFDDRDDSPPERRHPGASLALAALAAAGLTGAAVGAVAWSYDRWSAPDSAGTAAAPVATAPDLASPDVSTPGWADSLKLPAPPPAASDPTATKTRGATAPSRAPIVRVETVPSLVLPSSTAPAPEPSASTGSPEPSASAEPSEPVTLMNLRQRPPWAQRPQLRRPDRIRWVFRP